MAPGVYLFYCRDRFAVNGETAGFAGSPGCGNCIAAPGTAAGYSGGVAVASWMAFVLALAAESNYWDAAWVVGSVAEPNCLDAVWVVGSVAEPSH